MDPAELRAKNLLKKGQELRPGLKGIDANLAVEFENVGARKSLETSA